ncbi:MAG: SHOCT domain-containing protein [Spirochaetia bacterium]|jgi:putative membrane protein|nr:SHOCT domain-containing protein [Spirochaetia bacterium]
MYRMWQGNSWGSGLFSFGFPWGGIVMGVVLIGVIVFAVFMVIRSSRSDRNSQSGGQYADSRERGLSILTERFARGEIDSETFRTMKAELNAVD